MRKIKTKEEFRKLFHYDHKAEMYIFTLTEAIIINEEVMNRLSLGDLVWVYNEELNLIKRKLLGKAESSRLN